MNVYCRYILIFTLLTVFPAQVAPAIAQSDSFYRYRAEDLDGTIIFSAPETGAFPTIHFQLDVYNRQGNFVKDLKARDVQVIEDGQARPSERVEQIRNGLQMVVAMNLSPTLANKSEGTTEYERIQAAVRDWALAQPAQTGDDFSLATPAGLALTHSKEPAQWAKAIEAYQPDLARAQSSLNSLTEALDLASDPVKGAFIKRSILFITPPLTDQNHAALADLASRAKQSGVRVDVWYLAPQATTTTGQVNPLQSMAEATGGQLFNLLPGTPLPDIDRMLETLRVTYQISYSSAIQKSGVHRLRVQVERAGLSLGSNELSFELAVQPPNPIFLSPPNTVKRTWNIAAKAQPPILTPAEVPLQILVEFADQHTRPLKTTRLFVNDKLVDENTAEPFDRFTWPVADLTSPGRYMLRVVAVDSLGLTGTSLETPIDVLVEQTAQASLYNNVSVRGMIALSAVVLAGGALVLVLILTSRQRQGRKRQPSDLRRMKDPVTQPLPAVKDGSPSRKGREPAARTAQPKTALQVKSAWAASAWPGSSWLKSNGAGAPARLVVLDENEQPITGGMLALARQEITFGNDPRRATQLIESPTVDGLHARLYRSAEGDFFLADQNSVAGTWINYEPVNSNGARLEHGDLIHIGRATFRFEITDASRVPAVEIKVTKLDS